MRAWWLHGVVRDAGPFCISRVPKHMVCVSEVASWSRMALGAPRSFVRTTYFIYFQVIPFLSFREPSLAAGESQNSLLSFSRPSTDCCISSFLKLLLTSEL